MLSNAALTTLLNARVELPPTAADHHHSHLAVPQGDRLPVALIGMNCGLMVHIICFLNFDNLTIYLSDVGDAKHVFKYSVMCHEKC